MTDVPDPLPSPTDATIPAERPIAPIPAEPEYYQPPRLGIIHFLAWTAVTAVFFKVDAAWRLMATGPILELFGNLFYRVVWLIGLTLMAAGIVGLAVLVRGQFRRQPGRFAPGHWILIGMMIPEVFLCVLNKVWYFLYMLDEGPTYTNMFVLVYLLCALTEVGCVVFFVAGARRIREKRGWKWGLCLIAVVHASNALLFLFAATSLVWHTSGMFTFAMITGISGIVQMLTLLVLVIVALMDLLRVRRDWLHCLGVGLYIGTSVVQFCYVIVQWFVR